MTTLPTCPREDCTASVDHYHGTLTESAYACERPVGSKCTSHNDGRDYATRCYAPRTPQPAPVVLPTVEEVVDILKKSAFYIDAARDVLDLMAARLPVWQPVEPGTVIKAGTAFRRRHAAGGWCEFIADEDHIAKEDFSIDPRTVPAEPEDPAVAVAAEWWEQTLRGSTAKPGPSFSDLLARIDAARADA